MPIRFATEADVPGLVEVARRMHAITRFKNFEFSEERITRTYLEILRNGKERYLPLVAIGADGQVVGGLLAVLERHVFSDQLVASVMQIGVMPEARMGGHAVRLLKGFEKWARNRDVFEISFGVNAGVQIEQLDRFAKRLGYSCVGSSYVVQLTV